MLWYDGQVRPYECALRGTQDALKATTAHQQHHADHARRVSAFTFRDEEDVEGCHVSAIRKLERDDGGDHHANSVSRKCVPHPHLLHTIDSHVHECDDSDTTVESCAAAADVCEVREEAIERTGPATAAATTSEPPAPASYRRMPQKGNCLLAVPRSGLRKRPRLLLSTSISSPPAASFRHVPPPLDRGATGPVSRTRSRSASPLAWSVMLSSSSDDEPVLRSPSSSSSSSSSDVNSEAEHCFASTEVVTPAGAGRFRCVGRASECSRNGFTTPSSSSSDRRSSSSLWSWRRSTWLPASCHVGGAAWFEQAMLARVTQPSPVSAILFQTEMPLAFITSSPQQRACECCARGVACEDGLSVACRSVKREDCWTLPRLLHPEVRSDGTLRCFNRDEPSSFLFRQYIASVGGGDGSNANGSPPLCAAVDMKELLRYVGVLPPRAVGDDATIDSHGTVTSHTVPQPAGGGEDDASAKRSTVACKVVEPASFSQAGVAEASSLSLGAVTQREEALVAEQLVLTSLYYRSQQQQQHHRRH